MRKRKAALRLGVLGAAVAVLPIVAAAPAFADYAPQPGDIVGVGGDTPQYAIDFAINGDANGDLGFNGTAAVNRVVPFDATADANGRSAYTNSVTTGKASTALSPTDVLRAGKVPVQRVSSSGTAIKALLNDYTASNPTKAEVINYVASASLPTAAQQTQAHNQGWTSLHVVEIATDSIQIAVDSASTHAPTGLSAADLLGIYDGTYTKWTQLPTNSSGSTDTIIPLLPPSGSSIYKTFYKALKAANGTSTFSLGANVKTVEQNDPTAITGASTPADAIVPFSSGRLALWNAGYFHTPSVLFPGASTGLSAGITLLNGAVPGGGTVYKSTIKDYVIFRQSDSSSAVPFEPGSALNWVQTLFSDPSGPKPFFQKSSTATLLAQAGVTATYQDLGNVSTG